MAELPARLVELLRDFAHVERGERAEMLIDWADQFEEVAPGVATRPFPERHHVQRCESDAYVWATDNEDGTLDFHFAVENPQGLSAKAWGAIMKETLSGQPLEQVAAVPHEAILQIFGRELSMGKGQGLMGMLDMVTHEAKQRLAARSSS